MGWLSDSKSNQAARYAKEMRKIQKDDERTIRANNKAFTKEAMKAAKAAKKGGK